MVLEIINHLLWKELSTTFTLNALNGFKEEECTIHWLTKVGNLLPLSTFFYNNVMRNHELNLNVDTFNV